MNLYPEQEQEDAKMKLSVNLHPVTVTCCRDSSSLVPLIVSACILTGMKTDYIWSHFYGKEIIVR